MEGYHEIMDEIELALQEYPEAGLTWKHIFTPGMYAREMRVPAGSVVTSAIHKTEHIFVVSAGSLVVRVEEEEVTIKSPFTGITYPGTRRVAYFPEDSVWVTFHPLPWITGKEGDLEETMNEAIAKIEAEILIPHENKLLDGKFKNKIECPSQSLLEQ